MCQKSVIYEYSRLVLIVWQAPVINEGSGDLNEKNNMHLTRKSQVFTISCKKIE